MCKVSHCVKHRPQPMQMQISFVLTNDMPPFCLLTQWKFFFNAGKLLLHSFINMRSRLHLLTNSEEIIGKFKRKKKPQLINTFEKFALLANEYVWHYWLKNVCEWYFGVIRMSEASNRREWERTEPLDRGSNCPNLFTIDFAKSVRNVESLTNDFMQWLKQWKSGVRPLDLTHAYNVFGG